jgi:hypothetical protein
LGLAIARWCVLQMKTYSASRFRNEVVFSLALSQVS